MIGRGPVGRIHDHVQFLSNIYHYHFQFSNREKVLRLKFSYQLKVFVALDLNSSDKYYAMYYKIVAKRKQILMR